MQSYDLQSIGEVQTGPGTHEALLDTYETPALCVLHLFWMGKDGFQFARHALLVSVNVILKYC